MVVNFEARLLFNATVNATEIREKIKLRFGGSLQRVAYVNDMKFRNYRSYFAKGLDDFGHPGRVLTLQRRQQMRRRG